MPGAMRKLGLYLGLVEGDEHPRDRRYAEDYEDGYDEPGRRDGRDGYDEPEPARAGQRSVSATHRAFDSRVSPLDSSGVRAVPAPVPAYADPQRITTLRPRTYNDAREIGQQFRDGTPVILDLSEMDDVNAKRLVDFSAGLIFGLHGRIERVTNKVFLLSPEHVEVTAEDRARIVEGGFFNQS